MNQAERKSNLTQEQSHTLRGCYTVLTGLVTYLEAHKPYTVEEDQRAIENLINFAVLNLSRLVEHFDVIAEFEQKGRRQ